MTRLPPPLSPLPSASGAAMDRKVPRRHGKRIALAGVALLAVLATGAALWWWLPSGLRVATADVRLASVEQGIFLDQIVVRANAAPLASVMLDAVDGGRVEEVLAQDGALVAKGQLLFRLSNPQRYLELLARQAEHAQQISNLSNLRVQQEASRTDHQRRLDELDFALSQADKLHGRDVRMAARGFISQAALEESDDRLAQQQHLLQRERSSNTVEDKVRHDALAQLENAISGLQAGLALVRATLDALAVRAPVAGRLTDFRLQVGETVVAGKHLGRIDDPRQFKLVAQVDEFYLNRVAVGRHASVALDGRDYAADISALYPQITDGRFSVELRFTRAQPAALNPGQSLDALITLGEPAPALLLPNGAFVNDSGGAWVFVLLADGRHAVRRAIRIGRRNNQQIEVLAGLAAGQRVIVSGYAAYGKSGKLDLIQ